MFYGAFSFLFLKKRLKTTTNILSSSTRAVWGHEWRARVMQEGAKPHASAGSRRIRFFSVRQICRKWVNSTRCNKRRQNPAVKAGRSEMSHENDTGKNRAFCVILTLHFMDFLHSGAIGMSLSFFFFTYFYPHWILEDSKNCSFFCNCLSPWQGQRAHLFLTQRIQGSFFVTINGVSKYSSGLWVKKKACVHLCCKRPAEASVTSIVHFNLWPKELEQLSRLVYKIDFIYFLVNLLKDDWACHLSAHVFRSPSRQPPERRRTQLRYDLSNSAAEPKSALRLRLVRESKKSIKFGIILRSFLQGGVCASGLHSYRSFEGTDDSTVRAQG